MEMGEMATYIGELQACLEICCKRMSAIRATVSAGAFPDSDIEHPPVELQAMMPDNRGDEWVLNHPRRKEVESLVEVLCESFYITHYEEELDAPSYAYEVDGGRIDAVASVLSCDQTKLYVTRKAGGQEGWLAIDLTRNAGDIIVDHIGGFPLLTKTLMEYAGRWVRS